MNAGTVGVGIENFVKFIEKVKILTVEGKKKIREDIYIESKSFSTCSFEHFCSFENTKSLVLITSFHPNPDSYFNTVCFHLSLALIHLSSHVWICNTCIHHLDFFYSLLYILSGSMNFDCMCRLECTFLCRIFFCVLFLVFCLRWCKKNCNKIWSCKYCSI